MKLLIFGSVASGKTTLARKLSDELNIIYYEGDCIAWGFPNEKRYKRSNQEQKEIIEKIDENSSWIIEGTYRDSQKILYDLADVIIFLDTPLYIRIYRMIFRFIQQKIGYEESNYKPTYDMLKHMFKWTIDFERNRNFHKKRLIEYKKKLIWIRFPDQLKGKNSY